MGTSAAHQATQTTQKAAAKQVRQDDAAQAADSGSGYETADSGYEAAHVFQAYAPKVEVCLGNCPAHAHCQHKATGACVAPVQFSPVQSYATEGATQAYGSRKLQSDNYAQQGEQTYGEQRWEPESYEAPETGCPRGTIDLNCSRLGRRTVLWVGFGLLVIPALYFWYLTFHDPNYSQAWSTVETAFGNASDDEKVRAVQLSRAVSFVICFIASLAYLTMALGYGYTTRCCDGRQFYYARYIDWALTTPLMIWKILERTQAESHEKYFLIGMDILMIVAGLIGSLVCGSNDKWAFFAFSMLCFIPVMYFICSFRETLKNDQFKGVYDQVVSITVCTWIVYPIIWILAEGTGTICAQAEAICYTVLDIIAKSLFGFILVQPRSNYIGGAMQQAGSML